MDPVSLAVGLVTTVAALAYKLHKLISECEIAEDQFEDLVRQFESAKAGIERLNATFARSALPATQLADYKSEAAKITDSIIYTESQLQSIRHKLNSPHVFTRFNQKRDLVDGELLRFSKKVAVLCNSLNLLTTTYKCTNTQSNEERLNRMEFAMKEMESAMKEMELQSKWNINIQFVQVVINQQGHYPIVNDSTTQPTPVANAESYESDLDEMLKAQDEQWDRCESASTPSPKIVNDSTFVSMILQNLQEDFQHSDWYSALGLSWAEKVQEETWANHDCSLVPVGA